MQRVYIAQNIADAYLIKSLLENQGIHLDVKNEILGSLLGEIPVSETYLEVWVDDTETDQAREIIKAER